MLLIGCVNVANLLLARGASRRGELALRLALGASRMRIVRQLLGECAVLALVGGVLSLIVARAALSALLMLGEVDSPWIANGGLNLPVLALTMVILYVPLAQRPERTMAFALRTVSDPVAVAPAMRAAIASFDADQALYDVQTMRAVWEADLQGTRILIRMMAALAAIALGLAGLGVGSVATQAVVQRTREIGVRMALGATAAEVAAMIAGQGLVPIALGLAAGLAAGLGLGQLMRSILFEVTPTDPVTIAVTVGVLLGVSVLATIGPALRAARLDPLTALRSE